MALSPEEQRLLAEMEAALSQTDPKLVNTLRGTPAIVVDRRRTLLGVLGLAAGLALLVAGMVTHPVVSVLGFLVMLVAALTALRAWQHVDGEVDVDGPQPVPTPDRDRPNHLDVWRRRLEADGD